MRTLLVLALALLGNQAHGSSLKGSERSEKPRRQHVDISDIRPSTIAASSNSQLEEFRSQHMMDVQMIAQRAHASLTTLMIEPTVSSPKPDFVSADKSPMRYGVPQPAARQAFKTGRNSGGQFAEEVQRTINAKDEQRKLSEFGWGGSMSYCNTDCGGVSYLYRGDIDGYCDFLDGDYTCLEDCDGNVDIEAAYICDCGLDPFASYSFRIEDADWCDSLDKSSACLESTAKYIVAMESMDFSYGQLEEGLPLYCNGELFCSYSYVDSWMYELFETNEYEVGVICDCYDGQFHWNSGSYHLGSYFSFGITCEDSECRAAVAEYYNYEFPSYSTELIDTYLTVQCDHEAVCSMSYTDQLLNLFDIDEQTVDLFCACGDMWSYSFNALLCTDDYPECKDTYAHYFTDIIGSHSFSFSIDYSMALTIIDISCDNEVICEMGDDIDDQILKFFGGNQALVDVACDCGSMAFEAFDGSYLFDYACADEECMDAVVSLISSEGGLTFSMSYSYMFSYGLIDDFIYMTCDSDYVCSDDVSSGFTDFLLELFGQPESFLDFACDCDAFGGSYSFTEICDSAECAESLLTYLDDSGFFASYSFGSYSFDTLVDFALFDCDPLYVCDVSVTNDFLDMLGVDSDQVDVVCDCSAYIDGMSYSFSYDDIFTDFSDNDAIDWACNAASSSDCYTTAATYLVSSGYASDLSSANSILNQACGNDDDASSGVWLPVGLPSFLSVAVASTLLLLLGQA